MPQLGEVSLATAARMVKAFRNAPNRQGQVPPPDATPAQLWEHARRVGWSIVVNNIRAIESTEPDPEIDDIT
jgi:hypothetical protein